MKLFYTLIFFLLSICASAQVDKEIPPRPNPPKLVNDYTNTLTPSQKQALEAKLVAYDDSTSSQVAIVIISTLNGYDIAEYGLALGRKWGIGGKESSNGVIIIVAKDDRKLRIEVGYGLEGAIPDITTKSIIDNSLTPQFKQNNYYRGLDLATDDIIKAAEGEYKAPAGYNKRKKKGGIGSIAGVIMVIIIIIIAISGGSGSGSGGTMSGAGWIIGSLLSGAAGRGGGGWSGGGGGSSGGGGFGGFGGGSFGGGGSSGSW